MARASSQGAGTDASAASPSAPAPAAPPRRATFGPAELDDRSVVVRKTLILGVTVLGLGLVLVSKHALAAQIYLAAMLIVHVAGLGILVWGVAWKELLAQRRMFVGRIAGAVVVFWLLTLIRLDPDTPWFWPALMAIFLLHLVALLMLHLRRATHHGAHEAAPAAEGEVPAAANPGEDEPGVGKGKGVLRLRAPGP